VGTPPPLSVALGAQAARLRTKMRIHSDFMARIGQSFVMRLSPA
jgi:hypothetical protein